MSNISVVFYSGYGHTKVIAQTFAQEIGANLVEIDPNGDIPEQDWLTLDWINLMQLYLVHQLIWALRRGNLKSLPMHLQKNGLLVHGKIKFSVALPIVQA